MKRGIILTFLIFSFISQSNSQSFDDSVVKDRMNINGNEQAGFSTDFGFSVNRMEKEWWKYARKFARPLNMKSYYMVTIPSSENAGNIDLILYSKTLNIKSGSKFFLSLEMKNLPEKNKERYNDQVKLILQDFKQRLYLNEFESQLAKMEKEARQISKQIKKDGKESDVKKLIQIESKISEIHHHLQTIYNVW